MLGLSPRGVQAAWQESGLEKYHGIDHFANSNFCILSWGLNALFLLN